MKVSVQRAVSTVLVLALLLVACGQPMSVPPDVEAIGDGAYLYRSAGQRSLFLITDDGVIVTDPVNASVARDYRAAIAMMTDQPVKFVVYSHYHWDRVAGAEVFTAEGAQVIAQEECARRFRDNPNDAVVMPDITFSDRYEVALGGKSLELYYFGPSHGDCLTVFRARPANVLQVVDLVQPPRASFPLDRNVPYVRPHNLRQFFAALEQLAVAEGIETVVASRVATAAGELTPAVGPVSIIADQARFWHAIYDAVETAEAEGNVGIDSFVRLKTIDLSVFEPYDGYVAEDLPIIMRRFVGFHDMGR